MQYTIDTKAVEQYAETLVKLHRSAMPTAVRATLNTAAFDVKKNTLQDQTKKTFTQRDRNFFKAFSRVDQAQGWDISKMVATVGMTEKGLKGSNNYAVQDLEQQEHGGEIKKRSFIAMRTARSSNSSNKKVRSGNTMSAIQGKQITQVNRGGAKSKKQQFVRAAIYAKSKQDGLVMGHRTAGGGRTLFRVDEISQNIKNRRIKMKLTPLYNVKSGRSIKVKEKGFMKKAASESARMMPAVFAKEAERQIKKFTT
jgi:hypothetical protein